MKQLARQSLGFAFSFVWTTGKLRSLALKTCFRGDDELTGALVDNSSIPELEY